MYFLNTVEVSYLVNFIPVSLDSLKIIIFKAIYYVIKINPNPY